MSKVNQKRLAEKTADAILTMIQCEGYSVGSKLPGEHELADCLEVGRNTLREAISILVAKDILEVRRGSGTYVSSRMGVSADPLGLSVEYDKEKMTADLILVRTLIEPKMAALSAQNATTKERLRLLEICDEMEELWHQGKTYLLKDLEFHALIASSSKNLVVNHMLPSIHQALVLQRTVPKELLGNKTIQAHRAIACAINDGRSSDAYDSMLLHLMQNHERIQ